MLIKPKVQKLIGELWPELLLKKQTNQNYFFFFPKAVWEKDKAALLITTPPEQGWCKRHCYVPLVQTKGVLLTSQLPQCNISRVHWTPWVKRNIQVSCRILCFGCRWCSVAPAPPALAVAKPWGIQWWGRKGLGVQIPEPWVLLQPCLLPASCCCPCCTSSCSGRFAWLSQGWVGKWIS